MHYRLTPIILATALLAAPSTATAQSSGARSPSSIKMVGLATVELEGNVLRTVNIPRSRGAERSCEERCAEDRQCIAYTRESTPSSSRVPGTGVVRCTMFKGGRLLRASVGQQHKVRSGIVVAKQTNLPFSRRTAPRNLESARNTFREVGSYTSGSLANRVSNDAKRIAWASKAKIRNHTSTSRKTCEVLCLLEPSCNQITHDGASNVCGLYRFTGEVEQTTKPTYTAYSTRIPAVGPNLPKLVRPSPGRPPRGTDNKVYRASVRVFYKRGFSGRPFIGCQVRGTDGKQIVSASIFESTRSGRKFVTNREMNFQSTFPVTVTCSTTGKKTLRVFPNKVQPSQVRSGKDRRIRVECDSDGCTVKVTTPQRA